MVQSEELPIEHLVVVEVLQDFGPCDMQHKLTVSAQSKASSDNPATQTAVYHH